jgi:hypothetical protein
VASVAVICFRSSHLPRCPPLGIPFTCRLQVDNVELSLGDSTIRSLHDTRHQVNARPFMAIRICATEGDRLNPTPVNVQCQARMASITHKPDLFEVNRSEEEERIGIPNTRWSEVVGQRSEC